MPAFLGLDYAHPAEVEGYRPEARAQTLGGGVSTIRTGYTRWRVTMAFTPQVHGRAGVNARLAVHRAKQGTSAPFSLPMPQLVSGAISDHSGQVLSAAAAVGDETVSIQATHSVSLEVGRFIAFAGHDKVYQVDGTSSYTVSSTAVTVSLVPALQAAVASGARWYPNPSLQCRYARVSGGHWETDILGTVQTSITVEEV